MNDLAQALNRLSAALERIAARLEARGSGLGTVKGLGGEAQAAAPEVSSPETVAAALTETPETPVPPEPSAPPSVFPGTGPWTVVQTHATEDVIFVCEPDATEEHVRDALSKCDPMLAPFRATSAGSAESVNPMQHLFTYLRDPFFPQEANLAEWWVYLENGQRIAHIPANASWPRLVMHFMADLDALGIEFPAFPWACLAMPRREGEDEALPRNIQHFTLRPEHGAWKAWGDQQVAQYKQLVRAHRQEAIAAPAPAAFFAPVPQGVTGWRLHTRDEQGCMGFVAEVAPNASKAEVAAALREHLLPGPRTFDATGQPTSDTWTAASWVNAVSRVRVCTFSLSDLEPERFFRTSAPWLHIEAPPWLPPTRVPGYYTREEVVAHVRVYAAPEWLTEIKAHGIALTVQPLDGGLLPLDADKSPVTVSLFASDF